MHINDIKDKLPGDLYEVLSKSVGELRSCQEKAVNLGLLENKSLLVCTPTASGKTLVGEIALVKCVMEGRGKGIYIAPLKALASEKYNDFKKKYAGLIRSAISIGDLDSVDSYLSEYDIIFCTSEKLDSLIRHSAPWLKYVKTVVVDEIHLLNDSERGPTLEITLTLLKSVLPGLQLVGLSATIGNPDELAGWLGAGLVLDSWRPVKLKKGVYFGGRVEFFD
jgi:helicase